MAFLLVDSITEFEPARRARGCVALPQSPALPPSLLAEAVGQLAAWVAMERTGFRSRPVAGLAGECTMLSEAPRGTTLEMEVEIESCDSEAISYSGAASVKGKPVLEMKDCVGPMLPMEEFDDPDAAMRRFEQLRGPGMGPQEFARDVTLPVKFDPVDSQPGKSARASITVPATASFYADHFPRKPIFPGTLLLDAQIRFGLVLAAQALGIFILTGLTAFRVRDVKLRSFVAPGQKLELAAELKSSDGRSAQIALSARADGKRVSTASLELGPGRLL